MSASEILKLIETVDPADTAKLDEIDARVACFIFSSPFVGINTESYEWPVLKHLNDAGGECSTPLPEIPKYTRSRDALKAIRPEGWAVSIQSTGSCAIWLKGKAFDIDYNYTAEGATEELAELHAIIQAIEYERAI